MSKKGGGGTTYQPIMTSPTSQVTEREQSPSELALLMTQNKALESGIAISEEQNMRSQQTHDIWKETYLPIETGMIHGDASRENGYMDSKSIQYASDSNNYKAPPKPSGGCSSGKCGGIPPNASAPAAVAYGEGGGIPDENGFIWEQAGETPNEAFDRRQAGGYTADEARVMNEEMAAAPGFNANFNGRQISPQEYARITALDKTYTGAR